MLLDRKRIRRTARWVALGLVIVFGLAFVLAGVGNGTQGFSLADIGCSADTPDNTQVEDTDLQELKAQLAADPTNTTKMLAIAAHYEGLFQASDETSVESADGAIEYMNMALETDPSLKEVYLDLADLYIARSNYTDAVRVLNLATAVDPANPDVYLELGKAQRDAGNVGAAILAWQKYLELIPADNKVAVGIRAELQKMMTPSTITTVPPATTTTVSGTSTTVTATTAD